MTPASWVGSEGGSSEPVLPPTTPGYRQHELRWEGFSCWCATGAQSFKFIDPSAGRVLFVKEKVYLDEAAHGRDKTMKYRCLECWRAGKPMEMCWHKHPEYDSLLYGLDQKLTGKVWVPEGERDADSLRAAGVVAVAHHQGASHPMTPDQAQWLCRAKKVIIVADRDEAGSYLAFAHARHLLGLAVNATVVWPAVGKDATEHLSAGLGLKDFVPADVYVLAKEAAGWQQSGSSYIPRNKYEVTHVPGGIRVRRMKEASRGQEKESR
ncbi:toprim domain-containing protein [Kribbella sp. DT2]|uniref:toprim domain-containing protein n=1 Tax=Kribbella sp. DT2 TaxID=3393427 RepID=UPI003CEDBC75